MRRCTLVITLATLALAVGCAHDSSGPVKPTADEIDSALRDPDEASVPGTRSAPGTRPASEGWYEEEPDREALRRELEDAKERVELAEIRVERADAGYSRMRHGHGRGNRRVEATQERVAAKQEYAQAMANYEEVKARAGRWGVRE
jgi:hypothetical protein